MNQRSAQFGVFVGRFNPLHLGHERVIRHMLEQCGLERCAVIIGSSNAPTSIRHFFSYSQRRYFIKQVFPSLKIAGIPDYGSDGDWLLALDDLIDLAGLRSEAACFFSGAPEDVDFFVKDNRQIEVLNRVDGTTPVVSATEVRDRLIHYKSLDGFVNTTIIPAIEAEFQTQWEAFKHL